ncbi:SMC family ATPase [Nocardioides oleivorans]|uniref:Nuclease SbcCD subunit C n=1 Tax=Nocardioides oleivorans TaxID=273676 RepID=A0A4Q2RUQ9_9ACTN|nr:SMC family ATPase [Nocardioides oleivorans]RYB91714.1 SMC family ATPase [Nocardioides oleivorans]
MRLHHLEVTAFGPFADRVSIDFDALSDAGLFLLSGPTGAGKSSVLDAVCFALYGDVPGDRAAAKRLRSDHAATDVVPRVVLEATLSGRRFRIDRSPAWSRPKKRGTGTTTEQARVVISERRSGDPGAPEWVPLSTRLDETGHLVTRLVGMTLPQFCQVALLPQGRFQAFLRARSEDRHALLQQVFQTARFDRAERWLRDRRVALRRESEAHQRTIADLASRVSEVAGGSPPDDWTTRPASLHDWTVSSVGATDETAAAALVEVGFAAESELVAAGLATAGHELARLHAARDAALRERAALEEAAPSHVERRSRVDAARRAAAVRPLHDLALDAGGAVDRLAEADAAARSRLERLLADHGHDAPLLDQASVADLLRSAAGALTDLARVRPLRAEAAGVSRDLDDARSARESAVAELARVDAALARLPDEIDALDPLLDRARDAVTRTTAIDRELRLAGARVAAARTAASLEDEVASARQLLADATETRLVARESLVEIRELRLDGMAAEIAGKLAVGASCPVCGSAEHPHPAAPAPGAPDEAAERSARRVVDDLEVVVEAHGQQVRGLETQLATALAESGDALETLLAHQVRLDQELTEARADAAALQDLEDQRSVLRAELTSRSAERSGLVASISGHDTTVAVLGARLTDLHTQVAAVAGEHGDLDALTSFHQQVEHLAGRCAELMADLGRAREAAVRTREAADEVALASGFATSADAAAAWLDESRVELLLEEVAQHERDLGRVEEVLADDALARAAESSQPDLGALDQAHRDARERAASARLAHSRLAERARRLTALAVEVDDALVAWEPVRADLDLVADLSSLVEGKHPDNRLQMRLSAYVLAHRLTQVVEAANLRLSTMSDQRYSLVHTGQRGAGEQRGGLSLLVRDDWTGDSRDPATLSGGETFVVSLALALGLADVITQEAGGADLDTLFVDEGFGSLDAETLEDVMDTLDTLRDGGRVVGVVSHVPELQTRIPTQLRVHRGRQGSRVSLRTG